MHLAGLYITRSVPSTCSHTALRRNARALYGTRQFSEKGDVRQNFPRGPGYLEIVQKRCGVAHSCLSTLDITDRNKLEAYRIISNISTVLYFFDVPPPRAINGDVPLLETVPLLFQPHFRGMYYYYIIYLLFCLFALASTCIKQVYSLRLSCHKKESSS